VKIIVENALKVTFAHTFLGLLRVPVYKKEDVKIYLLYNQAQKDVLNYQQDNFVMCVNVFLGYFVIETHKITKKELPISFGLKP